MYLKLFIFVYLKKHCLVNVTLYYFQSYSFDFLIKTFLKNILNLVLNLYIHH